MPERKPSSGPERLALSDEGQILSEATGIKILASEILKLQDPELTGPELKGYFDNHNLWSISKYIGDDEENILFKNVLTLQADTQDTRTVLAISDIGISLDFMSEQDYVHYTVDWATSGILKVSSLSKGPLKSETGTKEDAQKILGTLRAITNVAKITPNSFIN